MAHATVIHPDDELLRASDRKYRLLFENMTTGCALHEIICDDQGEPIDYRFLEVNPAFEKLTGVSAEQILGRTLLEVMPNTEKYWINTFGRVALTGEPIAYQNYSRELGRTYDTWAFSPQKYQFAVIFSDVTERKKTETEVAELAERLELATRSAHLGIWDWDVVNNKLTWDDRMFELYGLKKEDFGGAYEAWAAAVHPEDRIVAEQRIADALKHERPYDITFRVLWKDGTVRHIKADGQVVRDEQGRALRMTGINYDITERVRAEAQLQFMAHHDLLTELPNRVLFMDRLSRALTRAKRHNVSTAVFYMDLDRFKNINDTFGHDTGDSFLKLIADCLNKEIRDSDTVARLGGDEFAVIVEDVCDIDDALHVAEKILESLNKPFEIDGHDFFVTCSIGISLFPDDADDAQTLLKHADTAMYRAKELGGNSYRFYSKDLFVKVRERLTLENDLHRALERDEFTLYYQPQIELATQKVIAIEALLRWKHPKLGIISPPKFMAVAEETGLIDPIGSWVLHTATKQLRAWEKLGLSIVPVAVNLSGRQFVDGTLSKSTIKAIKESEVAPALLELEITEGVVMHNPEKSIRTLERLSEQGIRIAIDDFGTGYSSLSYLKRYPISSVKIDQSFVHDVTVDPNDASIVLAIIAMSHNMGLRVIAEGVETQDQLSFLREHKCDRIQGFLVAPPLPASEMYDYLSDPRTDMAENERFRRDASLQHRTQ